VLVPVEAAQWSAARHPHALSVRFTSTRGQARTKLEPENHQMTKAIVTMATIPPYTGPAPRHWTQGRGDAWELVGYPATTVGVHIPPVSHLPSVHQSR